MAPLRHLSPSNLVLPAAIAVMLGLLVGFEVAPTFTGRGSVTASVDDLAPYRPPSPAALTLPTVEGDTPARDTPAGDTPSPDIADPVLDGLPALVIGDPDVLTARSRARVSELTLDAAPRGWVASYVTPGERRTEVLVAGDGDDPRWAGTAHTTGEVAGLPVSLARSTAGATHVIFERAGAVTGVSTIGLDPDGLAAVVTSLAAQPASTLPRQLPGGLQLVALGRGTPPTQTSYRARYERDDWYLELRVDAVSGAVADPAVAKLPPTLVQLAPVGARTAEVRAIGADASIGTDAGDAQAWYEVTWWEPSGTHVTLLSRGITLARVLELARSVRPATPAEWDPVRVKG